MARPAHGWTNALPDVRRATEAVLARAGSVADRVGWGAAGRRRGQARRAVRRARRSSYDRYSTTSSWTENASTSRTPSSTSSGARRGSGGSTTHRAGRRSGRAMSGCERSSRSCGRRCSSVSAGRRLRHSCGVTPAWASSAADCSTCPDLEMPVVVTVQPLRGAPGGCSAGRAAPGLAHDLRLACAAAGKDVSRRRKVGSRRSHTQASSKGA